MKNWNRMNLIEIKRKEIQGRKEETQSKEWMKKLIGGKKGENEIASKIINE